jgi:type II secretory ATPase GspE/PulE/Tfp pilus assembly ATPase PilB-like protein
MGIEPYLLSSALNGVVAQRLARTVCSGCVSKYVPANIVLSDAGLLDRPGTTFRRGVGCQQCHNSGFRGRAGIYAVMEVVPEIRKLIHHAAPTHELRGVLTQQGVLTLRQEGVLLALEGQTSLEEVLNVTHSEDVAQDTEAAPTTVACAVGAGGDL